MPRRSPPKEVGDSSPIFGIDVQELELLRNLEKMVWMYVGEDASLGDLINAANAIRAERRGRRKN
jgi:hypothetical protein